MSPVANYYSFIDKYIFIIHKKCLNKENNHKKVLELYFCDIYRINIVFFLHITWIPFDPRPQIIPPWWSNRKFYKLKVNAANEIIDTRVFSYHTLHMGISTLILCIYYLSIFLVKEKVDKRIWKTLLGSNPVYDKFFSRSI